MAYTPTNNPYMPGDPYSYDLKWMVDEVKKAQAVGEEAAGSAEAAAASAEAAAASAERAGDWEADARLYAQNAELSANNAAASAEDAAGVVAPVTQALNTQGQQISVLEGRMDTFASLTQGSTTGDAELQDVRVGADGTTYPTAGDAVRGQVTKLQNEITGMKNDDLDFTVFNASPTGTRFVTVPANFPAGRYKLSIDNVVSSDTQYTNCRIVFYNGTTQVLAIDVKREQFREYDINITNSIDAINFYGAHTWSDSADVTFTFENVKVFTVSPLEERISGMENDIAENAQNQNKVFHNNQNAVVAYYGKYFSHIGVDRTEDIRIPNQSIADVERSHRLGFKVMELNIRDTADQQLVCLHGLNGAFGYLFQDVNGESVTNLAVSSLTLEQIKNTIRFRSIYPKYRTAPFTLEEMLLACKEYNIIPLIEYQPRYLDMGLFDILDSIMGKDNYIVNLYNLDRGTITNAPCTSWLTYNTANDLVNKCNASGGIYFAALNITHSNYANFTFDDWKALFASVHQAGYFIGYNASLFSSLALDQRVAMAGADMIGSGYPINDFEYGNIAHLPDTPEFEGFTTNGTISDGTLALAAGQYIRPANIADPVFLGGGILDIKFNGSIILNFGSAISSEALASDGTQGHHITTYFEGEIPTFTITASSTTTIESIGYKAASL